MKYLSQGMESRRKVHLLLSLTKITSCNITSAIDDHLIRNFSIGDAALVNGCKQANLTVAINTLNLVAEIVEKINELSYK